MPFFESVKKITNLQAISLKELIAVAVSVVACWVGDFDAMSLIVRPDEPTRLTS